MIKEIRELLDKGVEVELECVDEESYLDLETSWRDSRQIILDSSLIVIGLYGIDKNNLELEGVDRIIPNSHFKYFRIKRHAPTFNDLIDVAVKAAKDGLLVINRLHDDFISAKLTGEENQEKGFIFDYGHKGGFENSINKINSLYTETFVIESETNLWNIKEGADGVLANSSKFTVICGAKSMFDEPNDVAITVNFKGMTHNELLYFNPLKGATVTQKRGK